MMRTAITVALISASAALSAEALSMSDESPPTPRQYTLEELDKRLDAFKAQVWFATEQMDSLAVDHTGATVERDFAKHVLGDDTLASIKQLREQLSKSVPAGSSLIPTTALAPLDKLMNGESCRFVQLVSYWGMRHGTAYHENLIHQLVDRLPPSARPGMMARTQALGARRDGLRTGMERVLKDCKLDSEDQIAAAEEQIKLVTEYNSLRSQIAATLPLADSQIVRVERSTPCPQPQPSAPRMRLVSRPDLAQLYPAEAVRYQVEGRLTVQIEYDSGGCVIRTAVLQSSGAPLLDAAGLEYGFKLVIQPGQVNGTASGGGATQSITFSLRDRPASQRQP
jgi:TonB family protein